MIDLIYLLMGLFYLYHLSIYFYHCRTWKFKDLCLTATFPSFDEAVFDRVSNVRYSIPLNVVTVHRKEKCPWKL